jgi:uncharacterized protein (TIGR00369 family)
MTVLPSPANLDYVIAAFERIPHARALGIELVDIAEGRGTMVLPYHERLIGNPRTGVVHGGAITTLLDTLCGMVVMSAVPRGTAIATLDLRIDYLHPATPGEAIRAQVECYKATRAIAFVRGVAFQGDPADPIAHTAGTFILGATGYSSGGGRAEQGGGQPC